MQSQAALGSCRLRRAGAEADTLILRPAAAFGLSEAVSASHQLLAWPRRFCKEKPRGADSKVKVCMDRTGKLGGPWRDDGDVTTPWACSRRTEATEPGGNDDRGAASFQSSPGCTGHRCQKLSGDSAEATAPRRRWTPGGCVCASWLRAAERLRG